MHQLVAGSADPRLLGQGDLRPREGEHFVGAAVGGAHANPISRRHGNRAQHDMVGAPPPARRSHHSYGGRRRRIRRPHHDAARRVAHQDRNRIVPGARQVVVRPVAVARHLGDDASAARLEALAQQLDLVRRQPVPMKPDRPARHDADRQDPETGAATRRRPACHPPRTDECDQAQKQDAHGLGTSSASARLLPRRSAASSA